VSPRNSATWTVDNPSAATEIDAVIRQPHHQRRLDYVFVGSWHTRPHARAEIRAAKLALNEPVNDIWPSDHYGLLVDLDVTVDSQR
jgi:endonuclease/exonuclease/phosphatase family metal-dependent hydrolase